ncbi:MULTISPECIES: ABC transporter permease [unclassified Granulicatella]|uniref:ABC transporter permease n=1 Tax=unclassified Granulicatella TaxID=2630493 RepID=UPI0010737592|nr:MULTISPECIES: ABC transporter permease [unclassified Granulicatella]MBF0779827.1 ABC transporter permease [Granulicatella sp. 19428wC4_WM01]TFU96127.1 ABC transporter permease [Granulicatella sp. WM01]
MAKTKNKEQDNKKAVIGFGVIVREFKRDKVAMASFIIFVLLIAAIFIVSLFLDTEKAMQVSILNRYASPGTKHFILGADEAGREILWQLIIGARNSITIGFSVTIISSMIGLIVGTISGYYGGRVDNGIMRVVDFVSILPRLLFIIAFLQIVPKYSIFAFILIMSAFSWTSYTRLYRSKALSESALEYIKAAKTLGASDFRIMTRELVPNMSSVIIVNLVLAFAGNIGLETGLSYLGFGLPSSTPSLGTLISYASNSDVIKNKIWVWLPASLLILVLMLCINYIGQALQRASDSKQRLG